MDHYLPEHTKWSKGAEKVIRRMTKDASPYSQTLPRPAMPLISLTRTAASDGVVGGLDYDRKVDSMILDLPRVENVPEEWDKVYGNVEAKELLFAAMMIDPERSNYRAKTIVLFGPPGTGKTMMWMAAARFAGWTFFNVVGDVIQQTYQG